jgi:hypothetical protein
VNTSAAACDAHPALMASNATLHALTIILGLICPDTVRLSCVGAFFIQSPVYSFNYWFYDSLTAQYSRFKHCSMSTDRAFFVFLIVEVSHLKLNAAIAFFSHMQ